MDRSTSASNVFDLPRNLQARTTSSPPQGWARAFDLVEEAAKLGRASEEHAHQTMKRAEELVEKALTDLRAAQEKIRTSESAQFQAERGAAEAEERVLEAEEWLGRFQSALREQLIERIPVDKQQAA